jgi:hypothetical protein
MQAMVSNIVAKNKEQVASKVEQLRGSQPSGSSVKKESWFEMAMKDA